MREVLFRGKQSLDGKWIEGSLMQVDHAGARYNLIFGPVFREILGKMTAMSHSLVDAETVGQFTGCVDRNGRRIFEGDIVQLRDVLEDPFNVEVFWSESDSHWGLRLHDDSCEYWSSLGRPLALRGEVVGNIFDDRT